MVQRRTFTQPVPLPKGTEFYAEVQADPYYSPGRLNVSQGVLEKDITIMATNALQIAYNISCKQYQYQDIIVKIWNQLESVVIEEYTNPEVVSLVYGTKYSITLQAHEGYIKSSLLGIIEERIYTLTRNVNVSAKDEAESVLCELIIESTDHQTITVELSDGTLLQSDRDDTISVVTPYWTKYTPTIESDPGYNPGIINSPGENTIEKNNPNFVLFEQGSESGYVTVKATNALENKRRVSIYKYANQKIHVFATFEENTEDYTVNTPDPIIETATYVIYEIFDTSTFTVQLIPDNGYQSMYPVLRYIENGETKTIEITDQEQVFTLDKNIELLANSEATITYHTISLIQTRDQTMYLSSGEYEDITGSVNLAHNSEFTIRVVTINSDVYEPGDVISTNDTLTEISDNVYTGIITSDNMIYITPAVLKG